MLFLVGIVFGFAVKLIQGISFVIGNLSGSAIYPSFCTNYQLIYFTHGTRNMTTLTVHYCSISICKFHIMVVEYFSMIFSFPYFPSSHPLGTHREVIFKPVHHIYIMNMLFTDMVAAKPVEIIPVAHLVFHLGHSFFPWPYPYPVTVPPNLGRSNIPY